MHCVYVDLVATKEASHEPARAAGAVSHLLVSLQMKLAAVFQIGCTGIPYVEPYLLKYQRELFVRLVMRLQVHIAVLTGGQFGQMLDIVLKDIKCV